MSTFETPMAPPHYHIHSYESPRQHDPLRNPAFHRPFATTERPLDIQLQELPPVFDYEASRRARQYSFFPDRRKAYQDTQTRTETYNQQPSNLAKVSSGQEWAQALTSAQYQSQFSQSSILFPRRLVQFVRAFLVEWVIEWWLMEILSWIFSASCMAAIVGVLFFYDGKELPQWNLGITLNGFVSVFSNIAKASLLLPTAEALGQHRWNWFSKESRSLMDFEVLDAASRGPWGSLLLLLRAAQVRGLTLASIGAAIILLCLPLDLFFQQIIVYPNVWVEVASPATIPRAITYSVVAGQYTQNNQTLGNADVIMSQVVQPFFYLNGTTPNLNVHCPTSNCTWDPFETLAVCSACDSRISQELEFGCVTGSGDWLTDVSDYYNKTSFPNITQCGYFLNLTSDNPVLMTGYVVDPISSAIGDVLETRLFPLVDAITRERYYQGSYAFKDVVDPILDFLIVGTPGGLEAIHRNETPVAHECVLTWCTQTIHSSFLWGKLSQNVSATFLNDTKREFPFTFGEDAADYIYNANISLTPPEQHLSPIPKSGGQPPNITFGVDNTTALQTIFLTDTIAPSFITIPSSAGGSQVKIDTVDAIGAHVRPLAKNLWLPPYGNTTHYVERIAETMTNTIRNSPAVDGSLVTVTGTAWDMRTHVKVRWAWVILPLVLLVFSLVFLIITVARSSREVETVGIWKTSAIAILFNGLDDDARKNVTPNCRMGEARTKARQLRVRLVPE